MIIIKSKASCVSLCQVLKVCFRSDFTLDEESVNYDMCSRYFWTKTKRYKTIGNCITLLECGHPRYSGYL